MWCLFFSNKTLYFLLVLQDQGIMLYQQLSLLNVVMSFRKLRIYYYAIILSTAREEFNTRPIFIQYKKINTATSHVNLNSKQKHLLPLKHTNCIARTSIYRGTTETINTNIENPGPFHPCPPEPMLPNPEERVSKIHLKLKMSFWMELYIFGLLIYCFLQE